MATTHDVIDPARSRAGRGRVAIRLVFAAFLCAIAGLGAHAWVQQQRIDAARSLARACQQLSWTNVRTVATLPRGTFLRAPSVGEVDGRVIVAGAPTASAAQSDRELGGFTEHFLIEAVGAPIGWPAGSFEFLNARMLTDAGGSTHLVWGESSAPSHDDGRSAAPPIRAQSIWHAKYQRDGGWSSPRRIYSHAGPRDRLLWNVENSGASMSASGVVDLVIPETGGQLLHVALRDSALIVDTIPVPALYATVVRDADGALYVAYVGGERPQSRQMSGLFLLRSKATGAPWSPPAAIAAQGQRGAARPRLFVGPTGMLHLLWGRTRAGSMGTFAVRHVASVDGGRSWLRPRDLLLPTEPFTKWRSALDRCGSPHVVVSTWTIDSVPLGRVLHSARGDSAWTPLVPVLGPQSAREAELGSDGRGTLYLVASTQHGGATRGMPDYDVSVASLDGGSLAKR